MPGPHGFAVRDPPSPRLRRDEPVETIDTDGNSVVRLARCCSLTANRPANKLARRRCRVHRIPSRVRDDHDTPLLPGETGGVVEAICPTAKSKFCPSGCFVAVRRAGDGFTWAVAAAPPGSLARHGR